MPAHRVMGIKGSKQRYGRAWYCHFNDWIWSQKLLQAAASINLQVEKGAGKEALEHGREAISQGKEIPA